MKSSLQMLAVMFGMANAVDFRDWINSIALIDPNPMNTKIQTFYDQLVSSAAASQVNHTQNSFDIWVDSNFAENIKYCDYTQGEPDCLDRNTLAARASNKYGAFIYLIGAACNIVAEDESQLSLDVECEFTFQNPEPECTTIVSAREHMDYDANGSKILQYYTLAWTVGSTQCESAQRRLTHNYYTDNMCYDTSAHNPCTISNIKSGQFYHQSCSGCCNFIQCDEYGQAFDRPCAPGTFWDQALLTCNHNNGQCMDDTCPKPTVQPTPAPIQYYQTPKPTKPIDTKCHNIHDRNPCTAENRKKGLYYFESCDSCCRFIQCDDFGQAFNMPCAAGTYWDQSVLTCNHNYGQCRDDTCSKPTTVAPTQKPTNKPKTPCPTTASSTTAKPTETPTRTPTLWTKGPTQTTVRPTATPTPAPSAWTKGPTQTPTTAYPTKGPTKKPTNKPKTPCPTTPAPTTANPTQTPTRVPITAQPSTVEPTTARPTTEEPSKAPTAKPTTEEPTETPTRAPTQWTKGPTQTPSTRQPTTVRPTANPTQAPSAWTKGPTQTQTTAYPTKGVTHSPTRAPQPCKKSTKGPTKKPTKSKGYYRM